MNGELEICSAGRYVAIALSNTDPPSAQRIVNFIVNRIPLPPSAGLVSPAAATKP